MNQQEQNKAFILEYGSALSKNEKTPELCDTFMTDVKLKEHILFFETIFPGYQLTINEMTAEGDRVIVLAEMSGVHKGEFSGIPATYKAVKMPLAVGYTLTDGKISDHWLLADQLSLMEQLGAMEGVASAHEE